MPTEPGHPSGRASTLWSIARNLADGTASTRDNIERVHDEFERTFIASADAELGSGANLNFHLENPDSADRSCYFYFSELTHEDEVRVELHTGTDNHADPSPLTAENNYIGSGVESVATVEVVGSFNSTSSHFSQVYIGSGTETVFDGYRVTVPPGESILLEMENLGGNNRVGARFGWAESELLTE